MIGVIQMRALAIPAAASETTFRTSFLRFSVFQTQIEYIGFAFSG
jgi:hypothetical protein